MGESFTKLVVREAVLRDLIGVVFEGHGEQILVRQESGQSVLDSVGVDEVKAGIGDLSNLSHG